jgi:RimJ/RimL family protein N-acetyltransferase
MENDLAHWTPARRPDPDATLDGARVRLEPIDAQRHAADLYRAAHAGPDPDPLLWRYLGYGPFADVEAQWAWIAAHQDSLDPLFYAIVDRASAVALGQASYLRLDPPNGVIEIGHIWFGAPMQRTALATEAIYLLARHAFDDLGNRRLEWKCDAANARSRAAAARFGFTFEGVFRQHMIIKGANRDTAWFSIIDSEWPAIRAAFEAWLAPENFDEHGAQRAALAARRT